MITVEPLLLIVLMVGTMNDSGNPGLLTRVRIFGSYHKQWDSAMHQGPNLHCLVGSSTNLKIAVRDGLEVW